MEHLWITIVHSGQDVDLRQRRKPKKVGLARAWLHPIGMVLLRALPTSGHQELSRVSVSPQNSQIQVCLMTAFDSLFERDMKARLLGRHIFEPVARG